MNARKMKTLAVYLVLVLNYFWSLELLRKAQSSYLLTSKENGSLWIAIFQVLSAPASIVGLILILLIVMRNKWALNWALIQGAIAMGSGLLLIVSGFSCRLLSTNDVVDFMGTSIITLGCVLVLSTLVNFHLSK